MPTVFVPSQRVGRWLENFEASHGETRLEMSDGRLRGRAADGSWFDAIAPFDRVIAEPTVEALELAAAPPDDWGILLVRKGGFAVARLTGEQIVESKVGQRHVQGRTKRNERTLDAKRSSEPRGEPRTAKGGSRPQSFRRPL